MSHYAVIFQLINNKYRLSCIVLIVYIPHYDVSFSYFGLFQFGQLDFFPMLIQDKYF